MECLELATHPSGRFLHEGMFLLGTATPDAFPRMLDYHAGWGFGGKSARQTVRDPRQNSKLFEKLPKACRIENMLQYGTIALREQPALKRHSVETFFC